MWQEIVYMFYLYTGVCYVCIYVYYLKSQEILELQKLFIFFVTNAKYSLIKHSFDVQATPLLECIGIVTLLYTK